MDFKPTWSVQSIGQCSKHTFWQTYSKHDNPSDAVEAAQKKTQAHPDQRWIVVAETLVWTNKENG